MKQQAVNPYLPSWEYVPDGEPHVFGKRLYVYGSHDLFNGADFCLGDYVCWSAPLEDLSDWWYEGVIYRTNQDPRNEKGDNHMCAPDVTQGPDGRFYLYYQLHKLAITSVAVALSPKGPFRFYGYVQHADGTPWGERKGDAFVFDPGILRDDDGKTYLYAGFSPNSKFFHQVLKMRGNYVDGGVCMELAPDMKTVVGEEHKTIPGGFFTAGTGFEGHGFFEASSPRKINGKYYLVYSSELSHELCYAVSDYPDRDFHYGGTLVSIGDIGFAGRTIPNNYTGNTHGGLVQVGKQWYVFYHRQTNLQKCARQGCAEKITILHDGSIPQVEMTSCGLNDGPLAGRGTYEARIACSLYSALGTIPCVNTHEKDPESIHPYFTQSGEDRQENGDQYIANMKAGSVAGFKYFNFDQAKSVTVSLRGTGEGNVEVLDGERGRIVARIPVKGNLEWKDFTAPLTVTDGVHPLFFRYRGNGSMDFQNFTLN